MNLKAFGGFRKNPHTDALYINKEGTDVVQISTTTVTVTGDLSVSGAVTAGSVIDNGVIEGPVTVEGDFIAEGSSTANIIETDASADELAFFGAAPAVQSAHIANVTVTGTYGDDDEAIETAINSIIAALDAAGIVATGAIDDVAVTGTYATDDNAIEAAINAIIDALEAAYVIGGA